MVNLVILVEALTDAHVRSSTDWYSFLKKAEIPFSLKRVYLLLTIQVMKSSDSSVSLLLCSSADHSG